MQLPQPQTKINLVWSAAQQQSEWPGGGRVGVIGSKLGEGGV